MKFAKKPTPTLEKIHHGTCVDSGMDFQSKLEVLTKACDAAIAADNNARRKLFSQIELFRIEIEEFVERNTESQMSDVIAQLDKLVAKIPLLPVKRNRSIVGQMEYSMRLLGLLATFVFIGIFGSVPILCLNYIDRLFSLGPSDSLSIKLRQSVSWYLLCVCGVSQTVMDSDVLLTNVNSCILTFAHASNLDGFMVSSTCPIPHYALAKKELFVVPFFSWFSLAVGGIPVDRENRERAINALHRSTEAVKNGKMCIVVAPEGTRSTTGHLNAFKKGTFHIWEQLRVPIVPVISYGAFELFPGKSWLNATGSVVIRYLKPIFPDEANGRDAMMRLLRKRMLEGLLETPDAAIGPGMTWTQRLLNIGCCSTAILANIVVAKGTRSFLARHGIATSTAVAWGSSAVAVITAALYVYNVYVIDWLAAKPKKL